MDHRHNMLVINILRKGWLLLPLLLSLRFAAPAYPQEQEAGVLKEVNYSSEGSRDPLLSWLPKENEPAPVMVSPEEVELPPLALQGVQWGGEVQRAVINDQLYAVGDKVEGAEIIKIDEGGVILNYKGKQFTLEAPTRGALKKLGGGKDENEKK
jgi:type II secretory pathway component PulC